MEYQPRRRTLDALMATAPSNATGQALLEWARDVQSCIVRGDLMLGILSVEEVESVPAALTQAAHLGVGDAWIELASWLTNPPIGEPDIAGADVALQTAIRANVHDARRRLAEFRWFYRREDASATEREETYRLLQQFLDENSQDSDALYLIGLLTCQGFGTTADPQRAFEIQQRAASLGNSDALFELYVHYGTGLGVPKDDHAALDANLRAATAGHPRAMYNMGAFHATGRLVLKDMAKAAEWYERASEAGNPHATATLAVMYATGDGVEKDVEYAVELFDLAEYLGLDVGELRTLVDI